jgi:hypothetical protein
MLPSGFKSSGTMWQIPLIASKLALRFVFSMDETFILFELRPMEKGAKSIDVRTSRPNMKLGCTVTFTLLSQWFLAPAKSLYAFNHCSKWRRKFGCFVESWRCDFSKMLDLSGVFNTRIVDATN